MQIDSSVSEMLGRYLNVTNDQMKLTASNLANQTTAGYTREVTSFAEADAVTLNGLGSVGQGVTVSTSSQRDLVLESSLHLATQSATSASSRLDALTQMESLFGLSATSSNASATTLGTALSGLSSAMTALGANPGDSATRNSALSAAQTLASAFNSIANGLQQQTASLNSQIGTAAGQVNALTQTVASLNGQIAALGSKADAGELEDQRQQAIQQLSSLVGVNQITADGNGITLTTTSGAMLVGGSSAFPVGTTSVNGTTQITAGDPATIQTGISGGSIGGLIEARDQDLPSVRSALDQLASAIGAAFNDANQSGVTTSGNAGQAVFSGVSGTGAAASIRVAISSAGDLAIAAPGEGSAGTGNLAALSRAANATVSGGESAQDFFAGLIGSIGDTVSSARTASTAATAAQSQAQTVRDSLSGVSLDDEASSLMTYQRAYQAAAKVMTIVDQLMESAINLGTASSV